MTTYTVNRPWRPENGKAYGIVEIHLADDFQFDDDRGMYGIVRARDLSLTTSFDVLRIVGRPEWDPRFNVKDIAGQADRWPTTLGMYGGSTSLSGISAWNAKLRIKRLEVFGVPGCGLWFTQCPNLKVDSALFDRVGWPVFEVTSAGSKGAQIRNVTSRNHWWSDAWGLNQGQYVPQALRGLSDRGISARGELVLSQSGFLLENFVHAGDGTGWKVGGTEFTVRGYSGGACFLYGVHPETTAKPQYADKVAYRHLWEAKDILVEDSFFCAQGASHPQTLLIVSSLFDEPPVFRRCVFKRGVQPWAVMQNLGASTRWESCAFIGWTDKAAAFAPLHGDFAGNANTMPRPAAIADIDPSCKFYAS